PPAHPTPSLRPTSDRSEANRMLKNREPTRSVAHLPEPLSTSYRNRVRNLSPRNRNQGGRIQSVCATSSASFSDGFMNPSVLRDRTQVRSSPADGSRTNDQKAGSLTQGTSL